MEPPVLEDKLVGKIKKATFSGLTFLKIALHFYLVDTKFLTTN